MVIIERLAGTLTGLGYEVQLKCVVPPITSSDYEP
jgi:hypothetical protein